MLKSGVKQREEKSEKLKKESGTLGMSHLSRVIRLRAKICRVG